MTTSRMLLPKRKSQSAVKVTAFIPSIKLKRKEGNGERKERERKERERKERERKERKKGEGKKKKREKRAA